MDSILIVDDEKKMRHILQLMLEREGFKTEQGKWQSCLRDVAEKGIWCSHH